MQLRHPARSFDLHHHLTILLVCAVSTVLLTRSLLAALGYPQVGGSKLHIAHVLWGGLLLAAACVACLAFLSAAVKPVAAIAAGIGFGLFIDEVGKFVTKDVDYFYRPAFSIIYIAFLLMFGVIRWLSRRRFTPEEAVLIALEALQRAALGALSTERRTAVLELMDTAGATSPLGADVRALLARAATEAAGPPTSTARLMRRAGTLWSSLTEHSFFRRGIVVVLVAAAAISAAELGWLLRDGFAHLTFSQRAFAVATLVADLLALVGALELSRSIIAALRWYDHAVLVEITVAQVFLYSSEQLAASLNLLALLVIWALIHTAIHFERVRGGRGWVRPAASPTAVVGP